MKPEQAMHIAYGIGKCYILTDIQLVRPCSIELSLEEVLLCMTCKLRFKHLSQHDHALYCSGEEALHTHTWDF